ncbi:MAG: MFS transporter [Candidatus Edwardsbacteria bacterium]
MDEKKVQPAPILNRSLTSGRIGAGLRISIFEGFFAQIHINLTAGMFLTGFALSIGLNNFGIGLLAAIPSFTTAFGFFSAFLTNFLGKRKPLCVITSGIGRDLFFVFVGFLLAGTLPLPIFFAIIILYNILLTVAGNAWLSWMSDLVPKEKRGSYFGLRSTILSLVGMAVNFGAGKLLDYYQSIQRADTGFILLFGSACLASTLAAIILSFQPEPPMKKEKIEIKELLSVPLKDKDFRALLCFVSFWYLLAGMASPFYLVFMIENLKMPYSKIAVYSIIAGIMGLVFQILWGKAIDKLKSKPVLTINFFCAAFLPLIWLFPRPHFLLPIWIDAIFTGIFWSGINLSLFNILLSLTEDKRLKEAYFAVFSTISGIFGFLASTCGGYLATVLKGFHYEIFGLHLVNFHLLFIFASLSRLLSLLFLEKVVEKEAYPTMFALHLIGDYAVRRLNLGAELILNTLRFQKTENDR